MFAMKRASKEQFDPRVFTLLCHRGLHDANTTENGLCAFAKAKEKNLPFELDVHLSKDGHLVVSHDSDLKRTTGKEGTIEEMDLGYLKKNYRLLDGEEVPSFLEVLSQTNEQVPIVVELKPYKGNAKLLAKALLNELSLIKEKILKTYVVLIKNTEARRHRVLLFPLRLRASVFNKHYLQSPARSKSFISTSVPGKPTYLSCNFPS